MVSSILPKNEQTQVDLRYHSAVGRISLFVSGKNLGYQRVLSKLTDLYLCGFKFCYVLHVWQFIFNITRIDNWGSFRKLFRYLWIEMQFSKWSLAIKLIKWKKNAKTCIKVIAKILLWRNRTDISFVPFRQVKTVDKVTHLFMN